MDERTPAKVNPSGAYWQSGRAVPRRCDRFYKRAMPIAASREENYRNGGFMYNRARTGITA